MSRISGTPMTDQGQIKQVLLNLYVNAWQAMPDGGEISIATANISVDAKTATNLGLTQGRYVKLSVTDTGVGMEETVRHRIFEPFFTTKERARGTGLGLASAYGIIKNHRGAIKVNSRHGYGTTFVVYLPATHEQVEEEVIRLSPIRPGRETILLVDDEANILEVTEEMLQSVGYKVLTARSGREAISLFEQNSGKIDLVILDMIMPGLGGGRDLRSPSPDPTRGEGPPFKRIQPQRGCPKNPRPGMQRVYPETLHPGKTLGEAPGHPGKHSAPGGYPRGRGRLNAGAAPPTRPAFRAGGGCLFRKGPQVFLPQVFLPNPVVDDVPGKHLIFPPGPGHEEIRIKGEIL